MNLEFIKEDMEHLKKASYININEDIAVHKKEIEMLDLFIKQIEILEDREVKTNKEFEKLMNSHQHLANEIDRLAEFIINNVKGEPKENQGAIDTAIRLLSERQYPNIKEEEHGNTR